MATIRFTTKIGSTLANVTSVVLADPTGAFGIRRNDTLAAIVAAGTAMTNTAAGTYEYTFTDIAEVEYTVWIAATYGGETHRKEIVFTATGIPAEPSLTYSAHDEVLVADVDQYLADFGEPVTVYTSKTAVVGRSCTGIVTRPGARAGDDPRAVSNAITVELPNDTTTGIAGSEWTKHYEMAVAALVGGAAVRKRIVRPVHQDAAMITWELG